MAVESTARKQPAENPPLFRSAPHNIEVEQALLGAILVNNEAFYRVSDFLEPEHFFEPLHQKIYKDTGSLVRAGKSASPITLKTFLPTDLDIGGMNGSQYLARLATEATTVINAGDYGRTVYDMALRRALIGIGEAMVNVAYDAPVELGAEPDRGRRAPALRAGRERPLRRRLPALRPGPHHRGRDGGACLSARRKIVGARDRPARSRSDDGRPAAFRPDHPGGAARHGQDRARHQPRLQRRKSLAWRGEGRWTRRVGGRRHRRLLFARNVGRAARHPHHLGADRDPVQSHPPRRDRDRRFRPHRRGGARDGDDPALYRRDRRPVDRPARGARAPAQAPERPRPPGHRLYPAAAGLGQTRRRGTRPGGDRDHHQPQGAGEGIERPDPRAVAIVAPGREPRRQASAALRPARIRLDRAGRRRRDVRVPRGILFAQSRAARRQRGALQVAGRDGGRARQGGGHHRQAASRTDRNRAAPLQGGRYPLRRPRQRRPPAGQDVGAGPTLHVPTANAEWRAAAPARGRLTTGFLWDTPLSYNDTHDPREAQAAGPGAPHPRAGRGARACPRERGRLR